MQSFWYISGQLDNGQSAFDGPYENEKKADEMGFKLFPGQIFEKKLYPTRDKAKATAMWKHDQAMKVGLNKALRPVRHPQVDRPFSETSQGGEYLR